MLLDRLRELGGCGRRLLVLEDPGPSADHLAERPERDALAVREAPSLVPPDVGDQPVDVFLQLPDQPRLPDPGDPLHGDQVDLPVLGGVVEQILDQAKLAIAAGEGWLDRGHPAEPPEADDPVGPPQVDRRFLALQLERTGRLVGDHRVGRAHRRLPDEDRAGRRDRLDPRRGVDEIARHHPLMLRPERDRGLAGQDPCPCAQVGRADVGAEVPDEGRELQGGADGALGVVLVRDRGAPERHHGVSDELLDHAAVALHDASALLEVAGQELTNLFGVARLRERREADEVGEENRDQAAFRGRRDGLLSLGAGLARLGSRSQRGAAAPAEPLSRCVQ